MKKVGIIAIIVFVGVFVLAVFSPGIFTGRLVDTSYRACIDKDGENRYEKNTVNYTSVWIQRFYTDYCHQTGNVREYYCNRVSKVKDRLYTCANGCEDGACKRKELDKCSELSNKTKLKIQDIQNRNETIVLKEGNKIYVGNYVVLGYKEYGGFIFKLIELNGNIIFEDISSKAEFKIKKDSSGVGSMSVMDKKYIVRYDEDYVKLKWSDEELAEKFSNCKI